MELRCPSRIHGKIVDGKFEVKCASKHCGVTNGVVVFHTFDLLTGEELETRKFQDPKKMFDNNNKKEAPAPCR